MISPPFFSIIIPVYNKSLTIKRCIESVLAQDLKEFEIIVINDGSTDSSEDYCLDYTDPRISYYKQDNKGVSSARNLGLDKSVGKYVIFLDADDYWGKDYLSIIYKEIISHPADVFFTGITKVYVTGEEKCVSFPYDGYIEKTFLLKNFYKVLFDTQLYGYVSNKIVNLNLINKHNIRFNINYKKAEDLDFFIQIYRVCESFFFIKTNDYYYIEYNSGTSQYNKNVDYFSLIEIQTKLREWLSEYMDETDKKNSDNILRNFAICAIKETPLNKIHTIPGKIYKINNNQSLKGLFSIQENTLIVMFKVFIRQIYLHLARLILKIWKK